MPNDDTEIRDLLKQLSDHQAYLCLFYILGFMSKRDSWYDFANCVRFWFEFYRDNSK